jgi:hypothetical protein
VALLEGGGSPTRLAGPRRPLLSSSLPVARDGWAAVRLRVSLRLGLARDKASPQTGGQQKSMSAKSQGAPK